MYHKLKYAILKEKKLAHYEALQVLKIATGIDDLIYQDLKNTIFLATDNLNNGETMLPQGVPIPVTFPKIDSIKIPTGKAQYKGEKGVFLCVQSQYDGLVTACKLENYRRKFVGFPPMSFDQFIDSLINFNINQRIKQAQNQKMDAERNQLKSETTPNKKGK